MRMQAPTCKRFQGRQGHHGADPTQLTCNCRRCAHADVAAGSGLPLCCGMVVSMSAACEACCRTKAIYEIQCCL